MWNKLMNFLRIGRTFEPLICTYLLWNVINIHIEDLTQNEEIADLWEAYYRKKHDINDPLSWVSWAAGDVERDVDVLNMTKLGGIFLLHACFITVAILLVCFRGCIRNSKNQQHKNLHSQS